MAEGRDRLAASRPHPRRSRLASAAVSSSWGGSTPLVKAHVPSPAAAIVRLPEVVEALQRDLERIRDAQGAKVLRVSQGELEAMFFGAGGGVVRVPDGPGDGSSRARPTIPSETP